MRNFHFGGVEPVGGLVRYLEALQSFGESSRSLLVTRDLYLPLFDLPFTFQSVVGSASIPDYAVIEDDDAILFLLRGVSRQEHAEAYVNSVLTDGEYPHNVGFPSCFTTWSAMIWNAAQMDSKPPRKPILIVAHSLGSGIAMDLMRRVRLGDGLRPWRCFTFGAPKVSYRNGLVTGRSGVWRYTLEDDPVPLVLPSYAQLPWFAWNNANGSLRFDRLGHPSANIQLGNDNRVRVIGERAGPFIRTRLGLIAWLMGVDAFGSSSHSLQSYINRFGSQADIIDTGGTSSGGSWGDPEYPGLPTPAERRRVLDQAARESIAETSANPAQWADDFVSGIPQGDRPAIEVKIGRYRGKRCVKINGEPIAFARTKKDVRELKRLVQLALWS